MMEKSKFIFQNNQFLGNAFIVLVSILVYSLVLINRSPNFLRPMSMLVRTGYTILVPSLYLIFAFVFRIQTQLGKFLSLTITLVVFALALAGAWASGVTESGILSGVIPMYDSTTYYMDALKLLNGENFSITSSHRPIFSAFFSVLLFISKHNLLVALSLLNLLVAISCYFVTREIQKTHGTGAAVFVLLILFMFYRFHTGAVRTESLGVAFSALGIALFWRSITQGKSGLVLAGIFLLSIAMIARAGAFFSLPMAVLWGSWVFRSSGKKFSWKFIFTGMSVIIVAFMINQFITNAFGTSEAIPFGNFSYSFYGLAAGGKSWADVLIIHPNANPAEIYKLAFELILEHPVLIVQGMLHNWKMFFSNTGYGLYSFMAGENSFVTTISYIILCLLCLFSLGIWIRKLSDPYFGFISFLAIGTFISIPFLPPTDTFRVRAYAASVVLLGLIPAMGIYFISKRLNISFLWKPYSSSLDETSLQWFSIIFLGAVLVGPFLLNGVESPPILKSTECSVETTTLIIRYDTGTMIHLVPQKTMILDWAPTYKVGNFRRNLHDFPSLSFAEWASHIKPDQSLFYALDYRTQGSALIVASTDSLPNPPTLLEICGVWEKAPEISHFKIFNAVSVHQYNVK